MSKDIEKEAGGVTKIIKACRAADAPLPSGRPLPERVERNLFFKGGLYLDDLNKEEEAEAKRFVRQAKYQRSKSASAVVKRDAETKSIEQLFEDGFKNDAVPNANDFLGKQHPIFLVKKKEKQAQFRKSLTSTAKKNEMRDTTSTAIKKEESMEQQGNAWASGVCLI